MLENFLLGPFSDLGRFMTGMMTSPPPTRVVTEGGLASARLALTREDCDLSCCAVENLHSFPVEMEPGQLFDLLMRWRQWPPSSFFPCLSLDEQGTVWLAYRWWKTIPVVIMRLRAAARPHAIIYDIVWGIGSGGYHSFLIGQVELTPALSVVGVQTTLSIFTTFPRTWLFPEAFHDQVNYDVYRKLRSSGQVGR